MEVEGKRVRRVNAEVRPEGPAPTITIEVGGGIEVEREGRGRRRRFIISKRM